MTRSIQALQPHLVIVAVCLAVLGAAAVLRPPTAESPGVALGSIRLPAACSFHAWTGWPCPGCGLTRSIVSAVHGDIPASLSQHRLGMPIVFYLFLQLAAQTAALVSPAWRLRGARTLRFLNAALVPLTLALFLNWIPTLLME